MSIVNVTFLSRRRSRKADPFAGVERDREPARQAMPAPAATDYATRIDVRAKAAEVVAQARAEGRPPWNTAPQPVHPDLMAQDAHERYGWDITRMDVPPAYSGRPYIPGVLGAGGRMSPRTAGVADDLASLVLFRATVERMVRPCCEDCQQAAGGWRERLYGTYKHHTWPVPEAAPREFGIATELRQAHDETAADADDAERAFARRYLIGRAA